MKRTFDPTVQTLDLSGQLAMLTWFKNHRYLQFMSGLWLLANPLVAVLHALGWLRRSEAIYRLKSGVEFVVPTNRRHRTFLLSVREIFGCQIYPTSDLSADSIIIDLGAETGVFTVYAAVTRPDARILAVEPDPENVVSLGKNVSLINREERIRIVAAAVTDCAGTIPMYLHEGSSRANSIVRLRAEEVMAAAVRKENGGEQRIFVEGLTLAQIFSLNGIKHCDLLKMDIEGAEHAVLRSTPGDVLGKIGRIVAECHSVLGPDGGDLASFCRDLERAGFEIERCCGALVYARR